MSSWDDTSRRSTISRGQHTREIMRQHGFEDAEIDKLIEVKAVFEAHWVE